MMQQQVSICHRNRCPTAPGPRQWIANRRVPWLQASGETRDQSFAIPKSIMRALPSVRLRLSGFLLFDPHE